MAEEASVIFINPLGINYYYQTVEATLREYPIVRLVGAGDDILLVIRVAHWLQFEQKAHKTDVTVGVVQQVNTVDFPKIEIWIKRGPGHRILGRHPIDRTIFVDLVGDYYQQASQLLRAHKRIMLVSSGLGILRLITMFLALQNENIGRKVYIDTWSYELETGALMQIVMEGNTRRRYLGSLASPFPSRQLLAMQQPEQRSHHHLAQISSMTGAGRRWHELDMSRE